MSDIDQVLLVLRDHGIDPPPHMNMVINSIVEVFRERSTEYSNSQRITGIVDDLSDLAMAATKLSVLLKNIHPQTFDAMGGDWKHPGQLSSTEIEQIIDPSLLAELSPDNEDRGSVGLIKNIDDLANLASSTRKALEATWKFRRENGKLDPGGQDTIFSRVEPHPKLTLAKDCHYVLVEDLKVEVTGSTGGLFYDFVAAVYEYATGQEAEGKGAGLGYYVKEVIKENR